MEKKSDSAVVPRPDKRTRVHVSELAVRTSVGELPTWDLSEDEAHPAEQEAQSARTTWITGRMTFRDARAGIASLEYKREALKDPDIWVSRHIDGVQIATAGDRTSYNSKLFLTSDSLLIYLPHDEWNILADGVRPGRVRTLSLTMATDALRKDGDEILYVGDAGNIRGRITDYFWDEPSKTTDESISKNSVAAIIRAPIPVWVWPIVSALIGIMISRLIGVW